MHPNDTPKLCECGCGELAPLSPRNDPKRGYVKGKPRRFIKNHHMKTRYGSAAKRFWEKVDKRGPNDCWQWHGSRDQHGYGQISVNHRLTKAHRFSYELHIGPIPNGIEVCHNCPGGDNPSCINPAHLFLGTHQDNMSDLVAKGGNAKGEHSGRAKLTESDIHEIRHLALAGIMQKDIARQFGVDPSAISLIVNRINWKHLE